MSYLIINLMYHNNKIVITKLFASKVIFSSLWETLVPFTRDYENIREALHKLEDYSKTCIESGLAAIKTLMLEEWGVSTPCQVTQTFYLVFCWYSLKIN